MPYSDPEEMKLYMRRRRANERNTAKGLGVTDLTSALAKIKLLEAKVREQAPQGIMDLATYRKILAQLHPDRSTGENAKRKATKLFQLFSDLKDKLVK